MIVLDTNVVSELMRTGPSPVVAGWVRHRSASELRTTAVTLAEIGHGIARLPEGHRKALLKAAAEAVFAAFPEQVLGFDDAAAREYGEVVDSRDRAGAPIDGFDAQIASICRAHDAALATRNVKDFADTGIVLVDLWQSPP
ncbi:MAG: type II toxin-antitoxin system VapC family toxin [Actinobacteria bacterium]|nr:type II toxin-antitoxin system VapC family toxin [Actinomycetota bacterium]